MITNYHITVKLGCVQNIGDYSNVRPEVEVSLSGSGDGSEARAVLDKLLSDVQDEVHRIVDKELEIHGRRTLYNEDDTYTLYWPKDFHFPCIVNDREDIPELWKKYDKYGMQHLRLENMQRMCKLKSREDTAYNHVPVLHADDLPYIREFTYLIVGVEEERVQYLILLKGNQVYGADNDIPREYYRRANRQQGACVVMDIGRFERNMKMKADECGYTIVDCLDEDYSKLPLLPEPPKQEEEEEEPDNIPFDNDDDDYDDEDYDDED